MQWPTFDGPIVAVVVIEDASHAVPLARALHRGGVTAVEVTMRTNAALDSLSAIARDVPEVILGAGTLLNPAHCAEVTRRGAVFGVAPGLNPDILRAAQEAGLPFAPGVATPTDIECALHHGCRVLKLFPATALGGPEYLKAIAAPYQHLGVQFMPTGGVSLDSLEQWLVNPHVLAVGGTWLARGNDIAAQRWGEIEERARQAVSSASRFVHAERSEQQ